MKVCIRLIFAFWLASLAGCQLMVPFISSFKEIGMTKGDRVELLSKEIKGFRRAVEDGKTSSAVAYVGAGGENPQDLAQAETLRRKIINDIRRGKRAERVVDSTVDYVNVSNDGRRAEVELVVRYFKVPSYVVNERLEKQIWSFASYTQGWKLTSREIGEMESTS